MGMPKPSAACHQRYVYSSLCHGAYRQHQVLALLYCPDAKNEVFRQAVFCPYSGYGIFVGAFVEYGVAALIYHVYHLFGYAPELHEVAFGLSAYGYYSVGQLAALSVFVGIEHTVRLFV